MSVGALSVLVIASIVTNGNLANALRSGAPSLACLNMRPFHGLHQPRPASASQFFVRQSALTYEPNGKVIVEITTHSNERHFRGFMVQAYDPANGQKIGTFIGSDVAQPMSCSAATHRNNQDKSLVSITWVESESAAAAHESTTTTTTTASPASGDDGQQQVSQAVNRIGSWLGLPVNGTAVAKRHLPAPAPKTPLKQVRFRATIVVSYDEYYTGFESSELNFAKWDYSSAGTQQKAS